MRLCPRLLRLVGLLAACAGCGASPAPSPPPLPTPWCADARVDVDRLPESLAEAWHQDPGAALEEADRLWESVVADGASLFHPAPPVEPEPVATDASVTASEAADTDATDADADAAVAMSPDATDANGTAAEAAGPEATDAVGPDDEHRAERAAALRAWTRAWRDSPRPVVDVGLDRFVPAPDLAEAAVEAAVALDDTDALDRWRRRLDPRSELASCVDAVRRPSDPR